MGFAKKVLLPLVFVFFFLISIFGYGEFSNLENTQDESLAETQGIYLVTEVRDGDTIEVDYEDKTEAVRLVGINTPETVDPRKPAECFGKEASNRLKSLLQGKSVSLETDETQSDKDRYGRLLRFVFIDGYDVGLLMLEEGYAQESLYSSIPHKYREKYLQAQKKAQDNSLGLWNPDACKDFGENDAQVLGESQGDFAAGQWHCDCNKTCSQMSSCAEAQWQLNTCGCNARDGNNDGVACDTACQQ